MTTSCEAAKERTVCRRMAAKKTFIAIAGFYHKKARLLSWLLFILPLMMHGQEPSYIQYTITDGLPSNTVYISVQDRQGYIWFGTDKGVSRFNGYGFENFTYKNGLGDNEIFDIYEDKTGRIWFSGYNGKLSFYDDGKFHNTDNNDSLKRIDFEGIGLKFLEDKKGNLFYITNEVVYSLKHSSTLKRYDGFKLNSSLTENDTQEAFLLSAKNDSFVISNLTQNTSARFYSEIYPIKILPRINSKSVIIGQMLYFSYSHYIIAVDFKKNTYSIAYTFDDSEQVQCFTSINENLMWVGTQKGLYVFDLQQQKPVSQYLNNVSVSSIYVDHEKNIWVTSLNKGVFQTINKNVTLFNSRSGLGFDKCIYLNTLDSYVVVGSQNFKCAFIANQKNITHVDLPEQLGEGRIENVKKGLQGDILISTGGNLYQVNHHFKDIQHFKTAISDVLITNEFVMMAQGYRILKFIHPAYNIEAFTKETSGYNVVELNIRAKKIFLTKDSSVFVIGNFGALKIVNNQLVEIHPHPVLNSNIVDYAETKDGLQWFASSLDGLLVVNKKEALHITTKEGLPSDIVSSITTDQNDHVWIGTQNGLCEIIYDAGTKKAQLKRYDKTSGLVSNSINDVLFYEDKIWAATDLGVCVLNKKSQANIGYTPYLIIESVLCGDEEVKKSGYKYVIPHPNNSLKLKYVGISTSSLNNMKYFYRLVGHTEKWTETKNTELEFPSLSPGEYKLEIKALNGQNKFSETKTIYIEIIPQFYQTYGFYLMLILIFVLISAIVIRLRIRAINKKHQANQYLLKLENEKLESEKKEAEFNIKLSELKQKALMLHMNPHFVFNSINAIHGFYATGDTHHAKIYVSMFSTLLRSILDFSQKKLITISEEVELLHKYLQLNQIRFNGKFNFTIEVDPAINQTASFIPPMIIQPFVENAIIHGIAPMESGGMIAIKIYADEDFIHCIIEDNGIGLAKSKEINKNRIHHSTGIEVSRDRIKIYAGENTNNCLTIEEKLPPEKGTRIYFKLRLDHLW